MTQIRKGGLPAVPNLAENPNSRQKNDKYHGEQQKFILWAQKFETARLYIELYEDHEKVHEDCLLSYGDFPM